MSGCARTDFMDSASIGSTQSTGLPVSWASRSDCSRPPRPFHTTTSTAWPKASLMPNTADIAVRYQCDSMVAGTKISAARARRPPSTDSILHRPECVSRMRERSASV